MRREPQQQNPINPGHEGVRSALRIAGPALAILGGMFMAIGLISFFSAFGSFAPPRYLWCCFVGMPLLAVGLMITKVAFMGAVARYMAEEIAPVGKETFNYTVAGTKDSVRDLAAAVGEGLRGTATPHDAAHVHCPNCRAENEPAARFCNQCGAAMGVGSRG